MAFQAVVEVAEDSLAVVPGAVVVVSVVLAAAGAVAAAPPVPGDYSNTRYKLSSDTGKLW